MNNSIKDKNLEEISIQLKRAEIKKFTLIKKINKEYEMYFQIVRELILTSVEKGIFAIYSDLSIDDKTLNSAGLKNFLRYKMRYI